MPKLPVFGEPFVQRLSRRTALITKNLQLTKEQTKKSIGEDKTIVDQPITTIVYGDEFG
jgi:hypothetical protein